MTVVQTTEGLTGGGPPAAMTRSRRRRWDWSGYLFAAPAMVLASIFSLLPLVLAFVLGNILETNFRQALLVGKGTLALFYTRPIAGVLIACSVALIALQMGRAVMRRHDAA